MPPRSSGMSAWYQGMLPSTLSVLTTVCFLLAHPSTPSLVSALAPPSNSSIRDPHFNVASAKPLSLTLNSAIRSSAIASSASPPPSQPTSLHAANSFQYALNLQSFSEALGGIPAPSITLSDQPSMPFLVNSKTFADFESAGTYACSIQMQNCEEVAANATQTAVATGHNGGGKTTAQFSVADCTNQNNQCTQAQTDAPFQTFNLEDMGPDPLDPEYELMCAS